MPEVTTACQTFTLEQLWEQRKTSLEEEEASLKTWEKLDEEQRVAVYDIVQQMLATMRSDLSWVPSGISVDQGHCIDVKLRILFSDITDEIIRRRAEELRMIDEAKINTKEMLDKLEKREDEEEIAPR